MSEHQERLAGTLLGTAVGDALGLAMEGMSGGAVARAFPRIDRFYMLGKVGFVSDDTEQSALLAQSLAQHRESIDGCVKAFRSALLGWFFRLPWGIGWGTLRACVRIACGLEQSGVPSAGNGAAMRAAVIGVVFRHDPTRRRVYADSLSRVTHTDVRAVEGARFVAELAALASLSSRDVNRAALVERALEVVTETSLRRALERAKQLACGNAATSLAAQELGNSGFVLCSVGLATYCFTRWGDNTEHALVETIRAGGDTDSNAAIVGACCGALHGEHGLPRRLVTALHDGPFGPTHLRRLAAALAAPNVAPDVRFSSLAALARNLTLFPVALAHALRVAWTRWRTEQA